MENLNPEVTGQMLQIKAEEEPDKKIVTFEYDTFGDESLTYSELKVEYYGKEKESMEKTLAGWHRSGDIVYQDEEGWLYFCNRKGEELRKYGEFIQPSLIEKILCEHEAIAEVCVYGVPSKGGAPGESDVVVAIAAAEDKTLEVKEIMDWCKTRLPKSHRPDYLQMVEEIPKTISQRPLTRLLKVDFREQRGKIYDAEDGKWL